MLAWNSGAYLQEAAGSILDQTWRDLELVLVDNGSTDGSVERLQTARPDPRLRVLRQETNLGIAAGTNLAIQAAHGGFIAIMDADDRSHPKRLELQMGGMAVDSSLGVLGTGARWMDENGRVGEEAFPLFHETEEIRCYMPYNMPVLHPTLLVRAEVFQAVPYRPEASQAADYDWAARAIEQYRFGSLAMPLLHYRRHTDSATIRCHVQGQAYAGMVRMLIARRRAGRAEGLAKLTGEVAHLLGNGADCRACHRHFARQFHAEGFPLQAAYHAALAVRERAGAPELLSYLRYLLAALRADRGSWRTALAATGKAPFWVLLRRAGFPDFPRY